MISAPFAPRHLLAACLLLVLSATACATTQPATSTAPVAPAAAPAPGSPPAQPPTTELTKPVGLHQVVSTLRGCLARKNLGRKPANPLPPKRGADEPLPELYAEGHPWGLVVRHELRHPCCLTGAIDAEIEGSRVVVTERLTGTPCNCYCWSTLITRVGLKEGDYDLLVDQVDDLSETTLLFTTVEVGGESP
jgi:hypothetical protein